MFYILEYFANTKILPEWFIEISNITENSNKFTGNYSNPYCCNMDIIREYFLKTNSFYRDDYIHDPFVWCPLGIKNGLSNYSIYYITVNILDFIEQLLKIMNRLPISIVQNFRQIQDRFQCLSMYMELESIYKDTELMRRRKNSIVLSPIEFYGPRKENTFYLRNLPDLHIHVLYCNFTGNSDNHPFKEPYNDALISRLSKALPYACKSRSVTKILSKTWNKSNDESKKRKNTTTTPNSNKRKKSTVIRTKKVQPSVYNKNNSNSSNNKEDNFDGFLDIITRFIFASLLGVYDHCTIISNFQVRRKLYANFMMNSINTKMLEKWIKDNGKLCTYIIREYLCFCTESLSGLTGYMRKNYFWDIMKDNTYNATNSVREFMNESLDNFVFTHDKFLRFGNSFYSLMEQYEIENIYFNQRRPKDSTLIFEPEKPWHKEINGLLNKYNKANLERAPRIMEIGFIEKVFNVTRTLNDEIYLEECRKFNTIVPPAIQNLIKTIIEIFIRKGKIDDISFNFLVLHPIYMLPRSLMELEHGYKLYEQEESRSKIKTIMKSIHKISSYDYHLLSFFFQILKDRKSVSVTKTPACMQRTLLNTLHRLYETRPGELLPKGAGIYYFCEACKQIKTNVYPYSEKRDKYRLSSLCAVDACLNLTDGKKYCGKVPSKANPKNRETNSSTFNHVHYDEKKKEKTQKKEARHQRKMDMINSCPNQELTMIDMKFHMITTEAGTFLLCPMCATMTELSKNFDNYTGNFSCGCINYDTQRSVKCKLPSCKKRTTQPVYYRIYDDSDKENPEIRNVPFCPSHRTGWITKFNELLTLSTISNSITENLKSVSLSNGERIFTETSYTNSKKKLAAKF